MEIIGRIAATEKIPTTIDEFYFWTKQDRILNPFDIVKVPFCERLACETPACLLDRTDERSRNRGKKLFLHCPARRKKT